MVKYRLVSTNMFDRKSVVMEHHNLAKLDLFIYDGFKTKSELSNYFKVFHGDFHIEYNYNKEVKKLDVIYNDGNQNFYDVLTSAKNSKIDTSLVGYRNIINYCIKLKYLDFFLAHKYIDFKTYNDLKHYYTLNPYSFDYVKDYNDLWDAIKYDIDSYIKFRRLYSGISGYYRNLQVGETCNIEVNTDDDLVNSCYKNGGLDAVYSCFDLDDLAKIGGSYTLRIDGINKK